MARIDAAAVGFPDAAHQVFHRLAGHGHQVEPEQHGPQAVFLAHVVRAGPVTFLTAQRDLARIQQVAEKLPAGGGFVTVDAHRFRHAVHSGGGGHGAGHAFEPLRVAGNLRGVRRQHGQAVGRGDQKTAAQDHVAVGVAVGRCPHVGRVGGHQVGHQVVGIGRVRVGVQAAEVFERFAVHHRAGGRAEFAFDDGLGVRPAHRPHGVVTQAETAGEEAADGTKVEQAAQHGGVVFHRVDDVDVHAVHGQRAQRVQRHVRRVADGVGAHGQRAFVQRLRQLLGRRAAVGGVVFDAEVAVGPARVVAGRQDDAAAGAPAPDDRAGGRGGQDAALAHQHPRVAARRRHFQDGLHRGAVVETPVTAQHQRLSGGAAAVAVQHVEQRLHEVFQVVRLLEHRDLFAQAGGAGQLAGKRGGGNGQDGHGGSGRVTGFGGRNVPGRSPQCRASR